MRILVISNCEADRAAAKAQLSPRHTLTLASNQAEASKLLQYDGGLPQLDIVFVDAALKETDGGMEIGIFIALSAAKIARYVGVFCDQEHYFHESAVCLEDLNVMGENRPTPLKLGNTELFISNNDKWLCEFSPENLDKPLGQGHRCKNPIIAKNYKEYANYILTC